MDRINPSSAELLFYAGLAIMAIALILTGICVVAFILSGRKLKEQLIQEYGEPLS